MNRDQELTTADLARASEVRGRSDDEMVAREQPGDRISADAPPAPIPARATEPARPYAQRDNRAPAAANTTGRDARTALFADNDAAQLRERWTDVQSAFVDEPRAAVERADSLVAEVMKRLAEGFAQERANLEHQWDRGGDITTEDLRVALQRYRSFFDRLLQV
jgi:hypothetical protein